jgi:cytochrome c oxidase subunit IV
MSEPILSARTYWVIFAILVALTALTVGVSLVDIGGWHTPAGLAIATAKGLLVGLFFMHVIHSPRLTWIVIAASLFWFAILMALTLADYFTRHWSVY